MTKITTKQSTLIVFKIATVLLFASMNSIAEEANTPPASPVKVESVRQLNESPSIKLMGTVYSQNQVELTAGVSGRLVWVIEPGTYIRQGERVAQIELLPIQLRHSERHAQYNRAKINLEYLVKELSRQKELKQKNNTSQLQLEQTESQVALAKADLEIAELQLKQVNRELQKATITSPFEGVITQRFRRAGFDVGPSEILVQLLDTRNLEVRVDMPIKYLAYTKPGALVNLSLIDHENNLTRFNAKTSTIIPAADQLSQTFEMRIRVPETANSTISTGQLIDVEIPILSQRMNLAVHRDALLLRSDGTYIVKIDENNIAHKLKVEVGKGKNEWVMISGDIKVGDKVAVRGAERLNQGQLVLIQNIET